MIPHGHPDADAVETDPAALKGSEDLDEDRPHVDPLEEGIETRYAHSGRFGTTPNEATEGGEPGRSIAAGADPHSPRRVTFLTGGRSATRAGSPYGRWYERT